MKECARNNYKQVAALYKNTSPWVRFHNYIRWNTCPFEKILEFVPEKGKILELGCGYGLMSNLLASDSEDREITGIDVSPEKLSVAEKTLNNRRNIRFKLSDIFNPALFETNKFGCIIIIDVLYLVPFEKWGIIFDNCYNALEDGGVLLLKEQDTKPLVKYCWTWLQEFLSVKIMKITQGETLFFPPQETTKELLKLRGFFVKSIYLHSGYLHPHILFVCRK